MLAALTLLCTSCGSDPVKFNDTIVDGLNEVEDELNTLGDLIGDREYDEALLVLDSLELHVVDCTGSISALNNKSGEQFKAKSLELLELVESEFIPIHRKAIDDYRFADSIEDEDQMQLAYDEIYDRIVPVHDKYDSLNDELIDLQKVFAEKNDIMLK